MMKSTEEAIVKIPILKYDGRQNLDFTAWKKSFATSMGQKYGELAQVYRTGEDFEYDIPTKPTISGDEDSDNMERTMFMERMAEYRKTKAIQKKYHHTALLGVIQQATRGFVQKATRRPSMGRSRKETRPERPNDRNHQDHVTILVRKCAPRHTQNANDIQCSTSKRERKFTRLLLQDNEIDSYTSLPRI